MAAGSMYSGRRAARWARSSARSISASVLRHGIGDQPPLAGGRILAQHDRRLAHRRIGRQRRLDLARLDAEAAHLDLLVGAAEELDAAVRRQARQVAGAIKPRPQRGARINLPRAQRGAWINLARPAPGEGAKRSAVRSSRPW